MSDQSNKHLYLWFTIILVALVCIPYLYGFANNSDKLTFSGSFIGVDDQNSYLAKMRYGYEGHWLYKSPYTDYPQQGMIAFLPFLLLGKLAGGENLVGQFQFLLLILRIASIVFYVYSLKYFFDTFFKNEDTKLYALLLAVFGGGFGFLFFAGLSSLWNGRLPLEIYSPEAFSFLALLTLPHIIIARAIMLITLAIWFGKRNLNIGSVSLRYEVVTAILGYLVYLVQPITLPILLGIIGIHILVSLVELLMKRDPVFARKIFRSAILYFLLMIPAIVYNLYLFAFDDFVNAWGKQNILTTPPIGDYLLAYGFFIGFSIIYFIKNKKELTTVEITLGIWIVISLIGIYLPISIQRRFIEGTWVFLVIFTIRGINQIAQSINNKLKMRIVNIVLLFSTVFIYFGSITQISSLPDRVFISKEKSDLYEFIQLHINGEYIFASHDIGNELPVWTSNYSITGVGPESITESEYLQWLDNLASGIMSRNLLEQLLQEKNIKYYIVENNDFLKCNSIYNNQTYTLCKVGQYE
jgi:hypothetical protein